MDKPSISQDQDEVLLGQVEQAKAGDRLALEAVVRAVQKDIYNLAMRFLWHPQDAEDATQEILIRVITGLQSFQGRSRFQTWVFRVACNALFTLKKSRMEQHALGFEQFNDELAQGLSDESPSSTSGFPEQTLLTEEIKIGCTLAMLLCLDRNHRMAYILGDILELDDRDASEVLEISDAAFRKRLSRARADVLALMRARCGLTSPSNPCRCRKRTATALALGRINPNQLLFANALEQAKRFPQVLQHIRELEDTRRAAALYRSHPQQHPSEGFVVWLKKVVHELHVE